MAAFKFGHPAIICPPTHTATVIFLHGLGDSGQNLSMISRSFRLPHVKWVFPTAPNRPITLNGGMSMPGWFDLERVDKLLQGVVDHEGIRASCDYLGKLVQQEVDSGLPPERIVIGGFSQGGHVAAKYAISAKRPPPACVMLSTWLEPSVDQVPQQTQQKTKFWIGHGTADPLIPSMMAETSERVLQQRGCQQVTRKMYNMQHSTCAQELDDVRDFLMTVIPEEEQKPPTPEEVERMSVKELRLYLRSKGVSTQTFLEKSEFVAAAKQTL